MKTIIKISLPYLLVIILIVAAGFSLWSVKRDQTKLKKEIINQHMLIRKELNEVLHKIEKQKIKSDSIYKPDLIFLEEQVLDMKENLDEYRIKNEAELEELYANQLHSWLWVMGLLAAVLALFGLDFHIGKKVTDYIGEELEKKNSTIREIFENADWEFQLMEKANIIIVNPRTEGDNPNVKKILKFFENKGANINTITTPFNKPDIIIQEINNIQSGQKFNVVLLENSDGNWDLRNSENKKNAITIASNIPDNAMLVYFGPADAGLFPSKTVDYEKDQTGTERDHNQIQQIINRISFVNAPSKLFPNLIDALKYLDIITDNNK